MKRIGVFIVVFLFTSQLSVFAHYKEDSEKWIYIGTLKENEHYFLKEEALGIARKIYQATDSPEERYYITIARHTVKEGGFVVLLIQFDFLHKKQRLLGSVYYNELGEEAKNTLQEEPERKWEDIIETTPSYLIFLAVKEYVVNNTDIRALYEYNVKQELDNKQGDMLRGLKN